MSNLLKWASIIGLSLLITACGAGSGQESSDAPAEVSLQYNMSAFLTQQVDARTFEVQSNNALARNFSSDQIIRGELAATAIGGANDGQVETFPWTIYLDEDTLAVSSNSTLTLVPGNYDFELLVTKGNQQYAGYSNQTVIDGQNDIAMTIKPIIGDVIDEVTIVDRLAFFKFQYELADLAGLTAPSIGIQVDADPEQLFTINTATGLSNAFVNITTGPHTLVLKLYDGSTQVGKSVTAQEAQTIDYGVDLAMDIVPLYSEVQFTLTEETGEANLTFTLPAEVVNEVGGVNNLTAEFALVGSKNGLEERLLTFNDIGNDVYQADLTLFLDYEEVSLNLTFTDATTLDQVADCNNTWTIDNQAQSFNCNITLIRRAVINSNILAVLGLTIYSEDGQPVSGAVITNAAGDTLGITNSSSFGTDGYLKLYLKAGDYELTATDPATGEVNTATVNLSPLEVENLAIDLVAPPIDPNAPTFGFVGDFDPSNWAISGVAASNMTQSDLTANVGGGGGGVVASITIPQDGIIDFDWAINVFSSGQYGDAISYRINGVQTNLSTAGSASGPATGITVSAGDVFEFSTWGSTQSSSYSAVYNNFVFTPIVPVVGFAGDFAPANWTLSGVAASSMSETALTASVGSGGGGVTAQTTIVADGIISFDWVINVFSAGQYGDSINYIVNGTQYQLSTVGTASGSATGIAVNAGDTFQLTTWGSTQSSSYNATFDNFSFVAN